ncbi:hypothetical protein HDF12_001062 [Edaphobacter lichenicola]|uniref:Uncharacterized protein n=1 Tax=Tunturiibacter lichenicola TaxID=2051959 RepID=A0A7Y9T230_9BACT|nr:hypothetical protein [Edaphobacter lichenicola]
MICWVNSTSKYWDGMMMPGMSTFYMAPKAQWKGNLPPAPDFFMHQTEENGPRLDAYAFGSKMKVALDRLSS